MRVNRYYKDGYGKDIGLKVAMNIKKNVTNKCLTLKL